MTQNGGADEGTGAEQVIGVNVRQYDVTDRQVGPGADRGEQGLALPKAAAAVDHRHAVSAHHEGEIGDAAAVGGAELLVGPLVDEDARSDFAHRQRNFRPGAIRRPAQGNGQRRGGKPHWETSSRISARAALAFSTRP